MEVIAFWNAERNFRCGFLHGPLESDVDATFEFANVVRVVVHATPVARAEVSFECPEFMLPPELAELRYRPLFIFQIAVKAPSIVGATPGHDRRIGEITGGRFEGERLRGTILSGGSDWQSLRQDGATTLNVRLVMQTDDDQLIAVRYRGVRHGPKEVLARIGRGENVNPSEYYMARVCPRSNPCSNPTNR